MTRNRLTLFLLLGLALLPRLAIAELTNVTITSRTVVAGGRTYGASGAYEELRGKLEFALDPSDPHNRVIADLSDAARAADGRVHFTSDLYALRPVDAARGNGTLLFGISNRGRTDLLGTFTRGTRSADPGHAEYLGDGFLMREGYTLVWVGWEFDVVGAGLKLEAPAVTAAAVPPTPPLRVTFIPGAGQSEVALSDAPLYPPADPADLAATLTVRDRFWDTPTPIARERWQFKAGADAPRVALAGGFEAGRLYEVSYHATGRRVAGVGMAATRDAAAAFRTRTDLPISGQSAYVFGISQSGRFLRDFLKDGFNADERDRRVFDAVWAHIAGAAGGSFNEPMATPTSLTSFVATRFPFADSLQQDTDGTRSGLLARYQPAQVPKLVLTNTPVEYWGSGRAAALTHTTLGTPRDLEIPENTRIYYLAGSQHSPAAFPPTAQGTQQLRNPVPQGEVMRALLRGLDEWVRHGRRPPESSYPRISDGTLVPVNQVRFPALPGVRDPRTITGPGRVRNGAVEPLPFLVPQVDADGNEVAGIRVPDLSVPLATTTGWNFRAVETGNPGEIVALMGSYMPFAATLAGRQANQDPRPSVAERYGSREVYLQKISAAAADLVSRRYLLSEDVETVLKRANDHWEFATRAR